MYIPRVLSADTVIIIVMYSKVYSVVFGSAYCELYSMSILTYI